MLKTVIVTFTLALVLAPGLAQAGQHKKAAAPKLAVAGTSQVDTTMRPAGTSVAVPIPASPKR